MYQSGTPCSFMIRLSIRHVRPFPFTDTLHDGKRKSTLHTLADQIDHNIISGTDGSRKWLPFLPRSVSGHFPATRLYRGKVRQYVPRSEKYFGLVSHEHLHGEISTKLRNSQAAKLAAANILRLDVQEPRCWQTKHMTSLSSRGMPLWHSKPVISCKHTDHGGIIVSQNIQLQQVVGQWSGNQNGW